MTAPVHRPGQKPAAGSEHAVIGTLSHDGRGVARVGGKAVFIEGALPGEVVSFRMLRHHREYDEARAEAIYQVSPDRVTPLCGHFGICGGCALQHLAPAAQLAAKQQALLDNLRRIGGVQPVSVLPPLTGPLWGYRRRARLSVRQAVAKDRVLVGFVEKHSPQVTDTRACEILDPKVGRLIQPLAELFNKLSIADRIPQVEVAVGEMATVLALRVLSPPDEADRQKLVAFEREHVIRFYLQPGREDDMVPLVGEPPELSYRLPEWDLEITFEPTDFIQVNGEVNRKLVKLALQLLEVRPEHRVLDLFCGLGNFTLPLARVAGEAVGVEGEAGLVRRARINAERNRIRNAGFHLADLSAQNPQGLWLQDYDRVLLDPPRAGAREVISQFSRRRPERIVYVSCHPATLARDAHILVQQGYELLSAGVLDMFPHTAHVESIALFRRRGKAA